jgi:hypothetical protein
MKKLMTMIVIIALLPSAAMAMRATTDANAIGCLTKSALEEMVKFTASGDRESFSAYIAQGKCIVLKSGLDVTVVESPGMFGGIAGFVYRGIKMWTTREALTNYR